MVMEIRTDIKKLLIHKKSTIIDALKKLNESALKVLLVVDENLHLLGTLSDGDIRRYILKTGSLEGDISGIYNTNPFYIDSKDLADKKLIYKLKKIIKDRKYSIIPVLENKKLIGYIEWSDLLDNYEIDFHEKIEDNIPCVIMAGGKGTRLKPFTQVLPKPLIPVKDKTIIELIIEQFNKFGINKFFITLNYKGKLIETYLETIEKDFEIEFIYEDDYLGTAGSLSLLKNYINGDFFVSNCDILVNTNLKKVYDFHKKEGSYLTSITSILHYKIPYGVININEGGIIESIIEKPEYTFQINTGVYLLSNKAFEYIPINQYFDMPQLINRLLKENKKLSVYPIKEKDYIDFGQWDEYKKSLEILSLK